MYYILGIDIYRSRARLKRHLVTFKLRFFDNARPRQDAHRFAVSCAIYLINQREYFRTWTTTETLKKTQMISSPKNWPDSSGSICSWRATRKRIPKKWAVIWPNKSKPPELLYSRRQREYYLRYHQYCIWMLHEHIMHSVSYVIIKCLSLYKALCIICNLYVHIQIKYIIIYYDICIVLKPVLGN